MRHRDVTPNAPTIRIDTLTDQQVAEVIARLQAKTGRPPTSNDVRGAITQTLYLPAIWANHNMVVARDVINRVRDRLREVQS